MNILILMLSFMMAMPTVSAAKLNRFTSDYCSSFFDGVPGANPELWADCCYEHDVAYWMGGTSEEKDDADVRLNNCVTNKTGFRPLGKAMELGVWIGGSPDYDTTYRWGYGWDTHRGYKSLNRTEIKMVEQELSKSCELTPHQNIIIKVMKRKGLRFTGLNRWPIP